METEILLESVIREQIKNLETCEPSSDEMRAGINDVEKLFKLLVDSKKLEIEKVNAENKHKLEKERLVMEAEDKRERREIERERLDKDKAIREDERLQTTLIEQNKINEEERARWWKTGLEIGTVVLTLACYGKWFKKGLKFEETGTYTSTTIRNLIGKFKPVRK